MVPRKFQCTVSKQAQTLSERVKENKNARTDNVLQFVKENEQRKNTLNKKKHVQAVINNCSYKIAYLVFIIFLQHKTYNLQRGWLICVNVSLKEGEQANTYATVVQHSSNNLSQKIQW